MEGGRQSYDPAWALLYGRVLSMIAMSASSPSLPFALFINNIHNDVFPCYIGVPAKIRSLIRLMLTSG